MCSKLCDTNVSGIFMSFMIAIIGRYGVGKSLLCDHFHALGINEIGITSILLELLSDHLYGDIWSQCLHNNYQQLESLVPFAEDRTIAEGLLHYIHSQQNISKNTVVVLPSFLQIDHWIQESNFTYHSSRLLRDNAI